MILNDLKKYGDFASTPTLGVLTHFVYDPKLKKKLPYYDKFPLCIPADSKGNGSFLGWNLHYVPQGTRKIILDQLYKYMEFYKDDPRARLKASYGFIKTLSIYPIILPAIKQYLYEHVKSRYLNINPIHYDKIIQMPTAHWIKSKPYRNAK